MIVGYQTIQTDNKVWFDQEINRLIQHGWQPLGHPIFQAQVVDGMENEIYFQAMVQIRLDKRAGE